MIFVIPVIIFVRCSVSLIISYESLWQVSDEVATTQLNEVMYNDCTNEAMEVGLLGAAENLPENNTSSSDVTLRSSIEPTSSVDTLCPDGLKEVLNVVSGTDPINSAATESHNILNKDIKV